MENSIISKLFTMLVIVLSIGLFLAESGQAQNIDLSGLGFQEKAPKALFEKADKVALSSLAQDAFTQFTNSKKDRKGRCGSDT